MKQDITCKGINLYNFGNRISSTDDDVVFVIVKRDKRGHWYDVHNKDTNEYEATMSRTEYELFCSQLSSNGLNTPRSIK
ncbi:MAG: hypothetical protein Q8M92_06920 [Candidatus Subteraquimicrobiales bacterium]|nr:hypothetical protein [Candidatus Subteraquimicrobiales bacterium]